MANDIKVGDLVQLKSNSPTMKVADVAEGKAWCAWLENDKRMRRVFALASLVQVHSLSECAQTHPQVRFR
jgi:uncharacterized protein YodC (DUF2158 family)